MAKRVDIIEEINMGIRRLSGKWEGQTMEWVEGNRRAFNDIINYIESLAKEKKITKRKYRI